MTYHDTWNEMQRAAAPTAEEQLEVAYVQTYRIGELPKWVVINEGGAAYIDTMHGRYWLKPNDAILYNNDWQAIDIVREKRLTPNRQSA